MKKVLIALDNNAAAQKVAITGYELSKALHGHTIMGFDAFSNLDVAQTNAVDELKIRAQDYLDNTKIPKNNTIYYERNNN